MAEGSEDLFKEEFKRFKKKSTDLREVLDMRTMKSEFTAVHLGDSGSQESCLEAELLGLKSPSDWNVLSLSCVPGLLLLPDLFRDGGQHRWIRRCLVDYPCKPNICNLDAHMERKGSGCLWPPPDPTTLLPSQPSQAKKPRLRPSKQQEGGGGTLQGGSALHKLRWVTLGFHYNWNSKEYSSERRSPFPEDLASLSSFILHHAGFPGFRAEAAIVNYYHLDSTLSGHTDHSEKDLTRPLLSISLGQSAIFLIGGKGREVRPRPLLLRSGDALIMSSEARLAYHGVPRILPPDSPREVPACLATEGIVCCHGDDSTGSGCVVSDSVKEKENCTQCQELASEWPQFIPYLSVSRINVNVRQVFSDGHDC